MIYLDNASTTPICSAAKQAIMEHLDNYGNPSSLYEFARESRLLVEDARERIAKCINAEPDEIYFTSGGSESDTWALNGRRSLASNIEHHAIHATKSLLVEPITGFIYPSYLSGAMQVIAIFENEPIELVSCMTVNNEMGTIQPIRALADVAHENGALFHTDAVQAMGHLPIDVKSIKCDMLSASGHKFGAPKGVGFLYIKNGIEITPLIYGGKQEQGSRGGTENILGIISMAAALEDAVEHINERHDHIELLRNKMMNNLSSIKGIYLNGSFDNRIVSNLNYRIDGVPGQKLVTLCDLCGVCISSGSACNEGQAQPSHVLKAIGLSDEEALNSIRITIGYQNTIEEIDTAADIITKLVERIRKND